MDVLQPHYGIGMCQAAVLLLVPDIPLTDKNSKNSYFTLNQILYSLQFQVDIYILPKM